VVEVGPPPHPKGVVTTLITSFSFSFSFFLFFSLKAFMAQSKPFILNVNFVMAGTSILNFLSLTVEEELNLFGHYSLDTKVLNAHLKAIKTHLSIMMSLSKNTEVINFTTFFYM